MLALFTCVFLSHKIIAYISLQTPSYFNKGMNWMCSNSSMAVHHTKYALPSGSTSRKATPQHRVHTAFTPYGVLTECIVLITRHYSIFFGSGNPIWCTRSITFREWSSVSPHIYAFFEILKIFQQNHDPPQISPQTDP